MVHIIDGEVTDQLVQAMFVESADRSHPHSAIKDSVYTAIEL